MGNVCGGAPESSRGKPINPENVIPKVVSNTSSDPIKKGVKFDVDTIDKN